MFEILRRAAAQITSIARAVSRLDQHAGQIREALGRIEERQTAALESSALADREFKVFSQWGEDGIIAHLVRHVPIARKIFVEFGVENYTEANTRWLLVRENWSGLIFDGSEENVRAIRRDPIYWRHNLKAAQAFITRENIDVLLTEHGITGEIGLLSVDIDGVDYWVWESITAIQPAIVVAEYNARFGPDRRVTVPYDANFSRTAAHHSAIYYGASIAALTALANRRNYALVGGNTAGNNVFFVRRDLLHSPLVEVAPAQAWRRCQFRETRDAEGRLTFSSAAEEDAILATLPLVEVDP